MIETKFQMHFQKIDTFINSEVCILSFFNSNVDKISFFGNIDFFFAVLVL